MRILISNCFHGICYAQVSVKLFFHFFLKVLFMFRSFDKNRCKLDATTGSFVLHSFFLSHIIHKHNTPTQHAHTHTRTLIEKKEWRFVCVVNSPHICSVEIYHFIITW